MRNVCLLSVVLSLVAVPTATIWAQPKDQKEQKEKSPADVAYDAFMALRNDKEAKPTAARFQALSKAGVDFVADNPKHRQAGSVIARLQDFAGTLTGENKKMRTAWFAQVQLDAVNKTFDDKLTDDGRAALAAIEAATLEGESREYGAAAQENDSKKPAEAAAKKRQFGEAMQKWRAKIDALAEMPGGGRFLKDREAGFTEFLKIVNPTAAEKHLNKLAQHKDKDVAKWANEELNLLAVRKQPYELKFTAVDGREIDFAQLRGKVVYLVFWSLSSKGYTDELENLKDAYAEYGRKYFEVIAVNYDKEADREKVLAALKQQKVKWPVYFDGKGDQNEFGKKLNVKNLPAGFLFDKEGYLVKHNVRMRSAGGDVGKLLGR
jgi:peroxiredoxin